MKKIFTFLTMAVLTITTAKAQTDYVWNCSAVTPTSGSDSNISSVIFSSTQGNNNGTTTLITTTSASSGYTGASGTSNFGAACLTGAINTSTSTYFSVTITPATDYKITLNSIKFGSRGTNTGPKKISIYSNIDNYTTPIGSATVLANSSWALSSITFSGTNLTGTASTPVVLRIYGSDGTGTPSSGTANWRLDDITLNITATSTTLSVGDISKTKNIFLKNTVVDNELSFQTKGTATVKVYNVSGQLVKSTTISATNSNLDVASLPKGNYVVTAELNGEKVSQKIIKK